METQSKNARHPLNKYPIVLLPDGLDLHSLCSEFADAIAKFKNHPYGVQLVPLYAAVSGVHYGPRKQPISTRIAGNFTITRSAPGNNQIPYVTYRQQHQLHPQPQPQHQQRQQPQPQPHPQPQPQQQHQRKQPQSHPQPQQPLQHKQQHASFVSTVHQKLMSVPVGPAIDSNNEPHQPPHHHNAVGRAASQPNARPHAAITAKKQTKSLPPSWTSNAAHSTTTFDHIQSSAVVSHEKPHPVVKQVNETMATVTITTETKTTVVNGKAVGTTKHVETTITEHPEKTSVVINNQSANQLPTQSSGTSITDHQTQTTDIWTERREMTIIRFVS